MAIVKNYSPIKRVNRIPKREVSVITCLILLFICPPSYGEESEIPLIPDTCVLAISYTEEGKPQSDTTNAVYYVNQGKVTSSYDFTLEYPPWGTHTFDPDRNFGNFEGTLNQNIIAGKWKRQNDPNAKQYWISDKGINCWSTVAFFDHVDEIITLSADGTLNIERKIISGSHKMTCSDQVECCVDWQQSRDLKAERYSGTWTLGSEFNPPTPETKPDLSTSDSAFNFPSNDFTEILVSHDPDIPSDMSGISQKTDKNLTDSKTTINEEISSPDDFIIDEVSNTVFDPETNTYFTLNNFGYYQTSGDITPDEELENRWNEIMDVLGREPVQDGNEEETYDYTDVENKDSSLEEIINPADSDNEVEDDLTDNENPILSDLSLEALLIKHLINEENSESAQDVSKDEISPDTENNEKDGEQQSISPVDYNNLAGFLRIEWNIQESYEDLISVLQENPELTQHIQNQLERHIRIYERDYPDYDLDSIGNYDAETFGALFPHLLSPQNDFKKFYKIVNGLSKATRDQFLGLSTYIKEKGNLYINDAKKFEMEGDSVEEATIRAWDNLTNTGTGLDPYKEKMLQQLVDLDKGTKIEDFLSDAFKGQYELFRMKDPELVKYEYDQNAIIRSKLQLTLNEKIYELKRKRGEI